MAEYSYVGKGEIYLGTVSNGVLSSGLVEIGNASKLALSVAEDTKELLDYTSAGGGTQNKIIRIKSIDGSMTLHNLSPENLALALRGGSNTVAVAAVNSETKTAYKGALVQLDFIPDWTQTFSVKNNAGDVTYVNGTDYVVKNNGIVVLSAGAITNSSTIKISYTKKSAFTVEGLINSGYDYRLVFNGLNEAQSAKPVSVTLYRVKFSPTAGLDFIGDDFGKLDLKCAILQDTTVVGAGLSQYIKVQLAA